MRRPATSPVKTEGERIPVGQGQPRSCVDIKSERTQDSREQYSKSPLISYPYTGREIVAKFVHLTFEADGVFLC